MKLICFLALIFVISCSSLEKAPHELDRRNIEQYYTGSGPAKFFLADLPDWANFSTSGQCQRGTSVRYIDYEKLAKSYALDYQTLVQLQSMLNRKLFEIRKATNSKMLLIRDEEMAMSDSMDRVQGGIKSFAVPDYARVNIVWIDELLRQNDSGKRIQKLFQTSLMSQGHPVIVSMCLSLAQAEDFLAKNSLDNKNVRIISAEMFSPYTSSLLITTRFTLNFDLLFKKDQQLHFFSMSEYIPEEFAGNFSLHKF